MENAIMVMAALIDASIGAGVLVMVLLLLNLSKVLLVSQKQKTLYS